MYEYLDLGINPDIDDDCQQLADYLASGLNWAIARVKPDTVAVRETRSYDAVDLSTSSFPLLKVYRTKEVTDAAGVSEVNLVVSYAMVLPEQNKLPGILHWVARHLVAMLSAQQEISLNCRFRVKGAFTTEYRVMVNDLSQPVYAYLRISFSAEYIDTAPILY